MSYGTTCDAQAGCKTGTDVWVTATKLSLAASHEHPGFFLRCFRDPNRVPRIENWIPRIKENYQRVSKIRENRVPTGPYRVPNIFLKKKMSINLAQEAMSASKFTFECKYCFKLKRLHVYLLDRQQKKIWFFKFHQWQLLLKFLFYWKWRGMHEVVQCSIQFDED